MATRRMFSNRIVDSAKFLKMPVSSRLLYYDLGMHADDDGVVEAFNVLKTTGATEDDLKVLVTKEFVKVLNEDLVSYITDWRENNKLRADRKIDSKYKNLVLQVLPTEQLLEAKNRADRLPDESYAVGRPMDVPGTTTGPHSLGQSSLGQDSIVIDRLYINYIKRDFDFENLDYVDKQNLITIFERCGVLIQEENIIPENKLKRFYFLRDIVADLYFSVNRQLLDKLNYAILCAIEQKCSQYNDSIESYWNYYRTALINKLSEVH